MIASRRTFTKANGFTIIELIVTIAVIGILAAITIVSYGAWQKNIAAKSVQSDLNGVVATMVSERNFSSTGAYPVGSVPASFKSSKDVTVTYKYGTTTSYCVEARSIRQPTVVYFLNSANENRSPAVGTCP